MKKIICAVMLAVASFSQTSFADIEANVYENAVVLYPTARVELVDGRELNREFVYSKDLAELLESKCYVVFLSNEKAASKAKHKVMSTFIYQERTDLPLGWTTTYMGIVDVKFDGRKKANTVDNASMKDLLTIFYNNAYEKIPSLCP